MFEEAAAALCAAIAYTIFIKTNIFLIILLFNLIFIKYVFNFFKNKQQINK